MIKTFILSCLLFIVPIYAQNTGTSVIATSSIISSASLGPVTDKGGQLYNVLAYGIKGNGVFLYDGVISSGSPNLSSASASWTSGDVGKAIEVDNSTTGAAVVISTIKTVTDAHDVVLNANASATVSSLGLIVYGTDDSSALNTLMSTVVNNGKGMGNIYIPCVTATTPSGYTGVLIGDGALGGGSVGQNAIFQIPIIPVSGTGYFPTLEIDGCESPGGYPEGGTPNYIFPPLGGGLLYGMTTESGTAPQILGGPSLSQSTFTGLTLTLRNLTVRGRGASAYTAIDAGRVANALFYGVVADINTIKFGNAIPQPKSTFGPFSNYSEGIVLPLSGNYGMSLCDHCYGTLYHDGIVYNEHALLINSFVEYNYVGFKRTLSGHAATFVNCLAQNNIHQVENDYSGVTVQTGTLDFEDATSGWYQTTFDLFAGTPGTLTGHFDVAKFSGGTLQSSLLTSGITNNLQLYLIGSGNANYSAATDCAATGSAANPSLVNCSTAPTGSFSCATNATTGTCVVSTLIVTANSEIFIQPNAAAGTKLSVTCNATADTGLNTTRLASISAGVSFTINLGAFTVNPECFDYWVVN